MAVIETSIETNNTLKCINDKKLPGNDYGPALTENETYEAKDVYTCECGQKHIDVGLKSSLNWVTCYNCKEKLPKGDMIHWCFPPRFEIIS